MYYMNDGVYGSFASKLSEDLNTIPEVHKASFITNNIKTAYMAVYEQAVIFKIHPSFWRNILGWGKVAPFLRTCISLAEFL